MLDTALAFFGRGVACSPHLPTHQHQMAGFQELGKLMLSYKTRRGPTSNCGYNSNLAIALPACLYQLSSTQWSGPIDSVGKK